MDQSLELKTAPGDVNLVTRLQRLLQALECHSGKRLLTAGASMQALAAALIERRKTGFGTPRESPLFRAFPGMADSRGRALAHTYACAQVQGGHYS